MKPYAAVTRNKFGDGLGWYVGTIIDKPEFYDKLVAQLLDDADVRPLVKPPQGVEISVRSNVNRRLVFVINHTDEAATVNVPSGQQELLSKTMTGETLTLDGFGVAVIEPPAAEGGSQEVMMSRAGAQCTLAVYQNNMDDLAGFGCPGIATLHSGTTSVQAY